MDWLKALSPFASVFQTGLWVALALVGFLWAKPLLRKIGEALTRRIEGGSSFKAGPIEVGPELRRLEYVAPANDETPEERTNSLPQQERLASLDASDSINGPLPLVPTTADWVAERDKLYQESRGVFLAHVISPSQDPGQTFDIFIFLIRHKSTDFTDISSAEFFFGHYWGNKVFRENNDGGPIGVSTSAYGPFLCTCRVRFRDGGVALVSRYVDFEMAKVIPSLEEPSKKALQRSAQNARRR
jgi:hypothetical protein